MTLDEVKKLHLNGVGSVSVCPIPFVVVPIEPVVDDQMAHIAQPAGNPQFNGLSINDVKFMHQFKGSDPLHLPSIVEAVQRRGKALNEYAKSVGSHQFVQSYLNMRKS